MKIQLQLLQMIQVYLLLHMLIDFKLYMIKLLKIIQTPLFTIRLKLFYQKKFRICHHGTILSNNSQDGFIPSQLLQEMNLKNCLKMD
jgi:hypothetical protein